MSDQDAQQQILQILTSNWVAQAVYVAAELGIANQLAEGPKTARELAGAVDADSESLYRLLRMLAGMGIFKEGEDGRFGLTPLARKLGEPEVQAFAVVAGRVFYQAWGNFLHSVKTGRPAFDKTFGLSAFEYLTRNAEEGKLFDAAMTGIHGPETEPMLDAYDFSRFGTVVDIGGGNGSVLSALLGRHPDLQGVLFDMPGVVERTRASLDPAENSRLRLEAGNFFESVTGGGDAYLMRHIIHDWNDDQSITILRNCRRAMNKGGKILVAEFVIPEGNDPSFSKIADLMMLVIGGKERTEQQYRELYAAAGLELTRVVPTATEVSVVEGVRR